MQDVWNKIFRWIEMWNYSTDTRWLFLVQLLLQVGGNLNAVDSEGLTPAMWACYFDQLQNLQFLHKALSRIDPEEDAIFRDTDCYGQCVIHWAVKGVGSLQCLEVIKKKLVNSDSNSAHVSICYNILTKGVSKKCTS